MKAEIYRVREELIEVRVQPCLLEMFEVPMKQKLFFCSDKVLSFKYKISRCKGKSCGFLEKIRFFTIKNGHRTGSSLACESPTCDVTFAPKVCLRSSRSCRHREFWEGKKRMSSNSLIEKTLRHLKESRWRNIRSHIALLCALWGGTSSCSRHSLSRPSRHFSRDRKQKVNKVVCITRMYSCRDSLLKKLAPALV